MSREPRGGVAAFDASAPSLFELARVYLGISLLGFGGPNAHLALMLDEVVEQRKPVVVRDTRRDPRVGAENPQAYLGSWIGVPLISQDRVAGVLTLESAEATYSANEAGIAFTFAGAGGIIRFLSNGHFSRYFRPFRCLLSSGYNIQFTSASGCGVI